jgi:hypothetical protein
MGRVKGIKFTKLQNVGKNIIDSNADIGKSTFKNRKSKKITARSKLHTDNTINHHALEKPKNLLSAIISIPARVIKNYIWKKKPVNKVIKNSIFNNELDKIYTNGLKTKNKTEAYKALTNFISTISEKYSTECPPTAKEKKALYNAYIEISGKYLSLLGLKQEKKISTQLKFVDLIQIVDQNRRSLAENIQDKEFISAVVTGLSDPKVMASSFVYEDCLGIYFKPDPKLQLNDLYKGQAKLESKNINNKETLLKQNNKSINETLSRLEYVKNRGLITQTELIKDIMNKTSGYEEVLTKKIIKEIKDRQIKNLGVDYITDTIMIQYEKELQLDNKKTDSSKNYDLEHIRKFIKFEVTAILSQDIWDNPLTETKV